MWPFDFYNPMIPLFRGTKAVAANVPQPGEKGTYWTCFKWTSRSSLAPQKSRKQP